MSHQREQQQTADASAAVAGSRGAGSGNKGGPQGGGAGEPRDCLAYTVKLLAGLPAASLEKLQGANKVAVYR